MLIIVTMDGIKGSIVGHPHDFGIEQTKEEKQGTAKWFRKQY